MTNASHTKLFFPGSLLIPNLNACELTTTSNCELIAEQEKAFLQYKQLLFDSDKEKRIQRAKEEVRLDDWSTVDVSILDREKQEKILNEIQAERLKQENEVVSLHGGVNACFGANMDGSGHEADQLCFDGKFTSKQYLFTRN